jgi:integral membrane sensor domain MASE1
MQVVTNAETAARAAPEVVDICTAPVSGKVTFLGVIAYLAAAGLGLALVRLAGDVAVFWPANAVLAAALMRLDRKCALTALVLAASGDVLLNVAFGLSPAASLPLAVINMAEAACAAVILRQICAMRAGLPDLRQIGLLVLLCGAIVPIASSAFGALVTFVAEGKAYLEAFGAQYAAHALGLLIVLPTVVLVTRQASLPAEFRRPWDETLGLYGLLAGAVYIVFSWKCCRPCSSSARCFFSWRFASVRPEPRSAASWPPQWRSR